jgi:NAD(P)-dependent dehydrogenase (short-subunit alcohol dehydrogenase family)
MAGKVEGKVAIVTGAARGVGRCIALLLAEQGATDRVTSLPKELLRKSPMPVERRWQSLAMYPAGMTQRR